MKILIAGCGKIGSTILESLVAEGHDVTAMDNDALVIEDITNVYDVMGVVGNCADCEILEEAEISKKDLFVAVTPSDELNMLSCFFARRMGAKHTIARIRNPEYNDNSLEFMRRELHLSMAINPEQMAAKELFNILQLPSAVKVEKFSRDRYEMIEVILKPNSRLDGMRLYEMRSKYREKFLVCVVQRGDEVHIPDGNFVLKSGDKLGITAAPSELQKLLAELGILQKEARDVMILGGSRTAYYLAKELSAIGNNVKIIERNEELCTELCTLLPDTVIIRGDGAHQELLMEEGLQSMDAFVALTGMDEENILISIFAASQNVPKVISKITRDELEAMADKLGLDTLVSPRHIVSNILLKYIRALENTRGNQIESLYKLMDGGAEALEFRANAGEPYLFKPLKEMKIKQGILIGGIIRGNVPIIPSGDDIICAGDMVIVIAAQKRLNDLSEILA